MNRASLLLVLLLGCSASEVRVVIASTDADTSGGGCLVGEIRACTCDGGAGRQRCEVDAGLGRLWSICVCS